ncbi:MAG: hypothetical protein IIX23_01910, partial [Oscillospiraceae bacterium]|nr:hypothetical protein [Oscillospiraceae bacterium]
ALPSLPKLSHIRKYYIVFRIYALFLLRCPAASLPTERHRHLPTAATRSGRLSPPLAALPSLPKLGHIRKNYIVFRIYARFLLRCPAASLPTERHRHLPTAATRFVEAQNTIFHFLQAENFICILASPLPTKTICLCGIPNYPPLAALPSLPKLSHIRGFTGKSHYTHKDGKKQSKNEGKGKI